MSSDASLDPEPSMEKARKPRTEAQLQNVVKARAVKKEKDDATKGQKERERLERRFDKLVDMFEQVRIQAPVAPAPQPVKVKRPAPPPIEYEEEYEEEDEEPPVKMEKPKPPPPVQRSRPTPPPPQRVIVGRDIPLRFF